MRPEELLQLIRRQAFLPLRIHTTDGASYEIFHPDQILVLRGSMDLGLWATNRDGSSKQVERVSLMHVVRVEEMEPMPPLRS